MILAILPLIAAVSLQQASYLEQRRLCDENSTYQCTYNTFPTCRSYIRCDDNTSEVIGFLGGLPSLDIALNLFPNVSFLQMAGSPITGTIPNAISTMPNLQTLDLSYTSVSGTIPTSIGAMQLFVLKIGPSGITGTLPSEITAMQSLFTLQISGCALSGSLPSTWAVNGSAMKALVLHDLGLSGTVPSQLMSYTSLLLLDLSGNRLSGTIAQQIYSIASLQTLLLGSNQLSGTIDPAVQQLQNMRRFNVSKNLMSGTVASELALIPYLSHIDLSYNTFGGLIPSQLGNMSLLRYLNLEINSLSGTIPSSLTQLQFSQFRVGGNSLIGSIPALRMYEYADCSFTPYNYDLICPFPSTACGRCVCPGLPTCSSCTSVCTLGGPVFFVQASGGIVVNLVNLSAPLITAPSVSISGNLTIDVNGAELYNGMVILLVNGTITGTWENVVLQGTTSECVMNQISIEYNTTAAWGTITQVSLCSPASALSILAALLLALL